MTDLSPAARVVWEAFNSKFDWVEDGVPGPQFHSIAAALRALVDQDETLFDVEDELVPAIRAVRTDRILALAAELDG